ncbi:hypothetical protein [Brevundimonas lenta]|uniref:Uncharacterized protein n=1 Tax=Brevundimonas lenta TaxID=424796 RepID=A0A7W6JD09_9CAUL|nr:hypothetical protein [Brevundimonas lenta]MBB4082870.1 hypothetical protein [Brevundimonas lenta]
MLLVTILAALAVLPQAVEERAPRHWANGVNWSRMPRPDYSPDEDSVVMARVTCTVADGERLQACRIDRLLPEDTRFGRPVLVSIRRARLAEGWALPGDTVTFDIWACGASESRRNCPKPDWPDAGLTNAATQP